MSIPYALKVKKYFTEPIDNTRLSMVGYQVMNNAQTLLASLKAKGWTNHSIADEIGVTVNAVEKWQSGDRNTSQSHLILLTQLTKQNRIPKKRRYTKGSRQREVSA